MLSTESIYSNVLVAMVGALNPPADERVQISKHPPSAAHIAHTCARNTCVCIVYCRRARLQYSCMYCISHTRALAILLYVLDIAHTRARKHCMYCISHIRAPAIHVYVLYNTRARDCKHCMYCILHTAIHVCHVCM